MYTIFTVFYRSQKNLNVSHFQNECGHIRGRAFRDEAAAWDFAAAVDGIEILTPSGKIIDLNRPQSGGNKKT